MIINVWNGFSGFRSLQSAALKALSPRALVVSRKSSAHITDRLLGAAKERKVFVAFKKATAAESFCNEQLRRRAETELQFSCLSFSLMMVFPCACVHFVLT